MKTVIVYLGGRGPYDKPAWPDDVVAIIAADSGLHLAYDHSVMPSVVAGDMDSVDPPQLEMAVEAKSIIEKYPRDKEETDFEIALLCARAYKADALLVIGGGGDRLDHLFANVSVLAGPLTSPWISDMITDNEHVFICRPGQERTIAGKAGDTLSIIPIGGDAGGVKTTGLKWELKSETLDVHAARGVSNELTGDDATVSVSGGVVAIITQSF